MTDWERVVNEHSRLVLGTAFRILGREADAEDVSQEVFLELFKKWPALRVAHLAALLHRLTTFRALDRLRLRRDAEPLDGQLAESEGAQPDQRAMVAELAVRLRDAVARLPAQEGAVFCLRYFEDLTPQRIAETLEISTGAVAVALHRARVKLEEWLHVQNAEK